MAWKFIFKVFLDEIQKNKCKITIILPKDEFENLVSKFSEDHFT